MELEQLQALTGSFEELKKQIEAERPAKADGVEDLIKQYDIANHKINDKSKRPDKIKDSGEVVEVTRVAIPYQKQIVETAAAFLCANPIRLNASPVEDIEKDLLSVVEKTWEDNKLDYKTLNLAELMMSECECAELWYTEEADELYWQGTPNEGSRFKLRMKVLAPSLGDMLTPVYNSVGDMVAFSRGYKIKRGDKEVECFDVYTATQILKGIKEEGGWVVTPEANVVGKIPIIYYSQNAPEWADVQNLIDRLEKLYSSHGDNNEYFGMPLMAITGQPVGDGLGKKEDAGKVIQLENGGKVEMVTWDNAPESVKLEGERLEDQVYRQTKTPDISWNQMKQMAGNAPSGYAVELMFLPAHLKCAKKEGIFGEGVQRRINYLKAAQVKINVRLEKGLTLSIKPKFEYFMPKNLLEAIQLISEAKLGGFLSQKKAVELSPLTSDAVVEYEQIQAEQNSAGGLNETFA